MPKVSGKLVLEVFTQIAESHSDITIALTMKLPAYLLALAWSSPCNRVYPDLYCGNHDSLAIKGVSPTLLWAIT